MTFDVHWTLAITVLFCATLAPAPARAEQPQTGAASLEVQQARAMIQALGSDSYSTRVQARNSLLQLGRAAIEPLEYAVKSEDPEVRLRAAEILIALRGRGFMGLGLHGERARRRGRRAGRAR